MNTALKARHDDQAIVRNGNNSEALDNLARACELFVDWAQFADGSHTSTFDAAAGQMYGINVFVLKRLVLRKRRSSKRSLVFEKLAITLKPI
jgi:hypothetical protein